MRLHPLASKMGEIGDPTTQGATPGPEVLTGTGVKVVAVIVTFLLVPFTKNFHMC